MKLKIILLIALSLAGVTQAYAKSHKSKHAHHRGHQWVVPSKSMCERYGGTWKEYKNGCNIYHRKNALKICRALGGRLPSVSNFRRVIMGCGGKLVFKKSNPYNADELGYPYTSCLKRMGLSYIGDPYYWTSSIVKKTRAFIVSPSYGHTILTNSDKVDGFVGCIR